MESSTGSELEEIIRDDPARKTASIVYDRIGRRCQAGL
jgi:hypothetical protein